jgi:hypothetical protein
MKNCKAILFVTLLVTTGYAGLVNAHNQTGKLGFSKKGTAATDVYQVTCSDDGNGPPAQLFSQVADLLPKLAPLVTIQITHPATATATTFSTDTIDGDVPKVGRTTGFSPAVTLKPFGSSQIYIITVNKDLSVTKGIENYNLQLHCQTAEGTHTGIDWIPTKDQ